MDKGIYISLNAARDTMQHMAVISNNLANASTTGFREDQLVTEPFKLNETQDQSRTFTHMQKTFSDFKPGPIYRTGRDLDVAISGEGYFAVQGANGKEGYTRAGDFTLTKTGRLETRDGNIALGLNGVIEVPDNALAVNIGKDGTVAVLLPNQANMQQVGQLKIANPAQDQLVKGDSGLFYLSSGAAAPAAKNFTLMPASLEGSNVSTVEALTQLIEVSRGFDIHMNAMKQMQDDASKANELLTVTG